MFPTDEPAVLIWAVALAPRPQGRVSAPGRHWWRDLVVDVWHNANEAWLRDREAVAIGYATEEREYAEANPRPTLKEAMIQLSRGAWMEHA